MALPHTSKGWRAFDVSRLGAGSVMNAMRRMPPPHPRALEWKRPCDPCDELRPRDPGAVVGAGLLSRVTAAPRGVPARRGIAARAAATGRPASPSMCPAGVRSRSGP
jgi:hypothetical protein